MKKILIATDNKFWLESFGSQKRISSLCRFILKKNYRILLFFVGLMDSDDMAMLKSNYKNMEVYRMQRKAVKKASETKLDKFRKRLQRIHQKAIDIKVMIYPEPFFSKKPKQLETKKSNKLDLIKSKERTLSDFHSLEHKEGFRKFCYEKKIDIILVEYIRLSYLVKDSIESIADDTIKLIDTHDVMHERCQSFHKHREIHWINITKDEETEALKLFDVIIAIQSNDAEKFREMLPEKQIIVAGFPSHVVSPEISSKIPITIAYIASHDPANKHAIEYFFEKVWLALKDRFNDKVEFNIYGKVCEFFESSIELPGVSLMGFRENLEEIYREADIVINPVLFGGGLKIKNVEALCYSKPLVTTSAGTNGLEEGINKAFLVCDSAESMIKDISLIIENPEKRTALANAAYEFSKRNFGEDKIYRELLDTINV
jgi:glycosyltransferase involved in cell wall biosynthesis